MSQLNTVAFRNKYRTGITNEGNAASEIEFIDIGGVFDTENGAVLYIQQKFIPGWDVAANGSLPEYYLVKSTEAERIYHITSLSASIHVTLWANA